MPAAATTAPDTAYNARRCWVRRPREWRIVSVIASPSESNPNAQPYVSRIDDPRRLQEVGETVLQRLHVGDRADVHQVEGVEHEVEADVADFELLLDARRQLILESGARRSARLAGDVDVRLEDDRRVVHVGEAVI